MITKKIKIETELEFPDDFTPPERYDDGSDNDDRWDTSTKCDGCPFQIVNDEDWIYSYCVLGGYKECPIKKCF